ncbi:MAG: transglutaminase domain-containing protein [Polyangiaceae bacterium]|nr:transglutaminase domain-containing protein [Polyangiaceae bacterium]
MRARRAKYVAARVSLVVLCAWCFALRADAQPGPLVHEYLPPNAADDVSSPGTVPGDFPSAIDTPSGPVSAPDVSRSPGPTRVYQPSASTFQTFAPDRQTGRARVPRYDDPFSPSLTPFKRLQAFDAVRDDYTLYVREPLRRELRLQRSAASTEEQFFADLSVELRAGEYVPIPTVGPGARLLKIFTLPSADVSVHVDGADNWTLKSDRNGRVRLVMEIAVVRDVFGSNFAATDWKSLPFTGTQPSSHRAAYEQVAAAIGVSQDLSPTEAVAKLVAYFRSFTASDEPLANSGDIYLDLALSKKGVCRHRAFAFLVTALHLGIPTRFVDNEAHAWVEVNDGSMWHRVDLGGAALDVAEEEPHVDRPPHLPPPDPYEWPTGRDSGTDLARRHYEDLRKQADPFDLGMGGQGPGPALSGNAPADPSGLPRSTITLDVIDRDVFRGLPLHLKGRVLSDGRPCARLRVDVLVAVADSPPVRVGSLSTDAGGSYDGAVVLPADTPIGDHELIIRTPGDATCGPGEAR